MKNVIWTDKDKNMRKEKQNFVENTTEIMQHVLKIQ